MAIPRCLSITELSMHGVRAVIRPTSRIQVANHHHWALHSNKPYGRSIIYSKDGYCARLKAQRNSLYSRPCGSWTRRYRVISSRKDSEQERSNSKAENNGSQKTDHGRSQTPFTSEHFFNLLRHDVSAAYKYMQKELERDPYKWIFDPKETGSAWNPVEWWDKRKHIFDRRRDWSKETFSRHIGEKQDGPPKEGKSQIEEEEFTIDPITLRKVPVVRTKTSEVGEEDLYPKYQPSDTKNAYNIPIKKYSDGKSVVLEPPPYHNPAVDQKQMKHTSSTNKAWLVQEGFAKDKDIPIQTDHTSSPKSSRLHASTTRIQTSLDRVKKTRTDASLRYPPKDITTDDVDLLRASDIRAASGHTKAKSRLSSNDIKERSETLENDWKQTEKGWTKDVADIYNDMLEKRKAASMSQITADVSSAETRKLSALAEFRKVKQHHDELRNEIEQTNAALKQARDDALQHILSEEANFVRQNFDQYEQRARKPVPTANYAGTSVQRTIDNQPNQTRLVEHQRKLEKLEKDAELVSQIKSIYEEKYGEITESHKQGSTPVQISSKEQFKPVRKAEFVSPQCSPQQHFMGSSSLDTATGIAGASLTPSGVVIRDVLHESIDTLDISRTDQKRLKFALRGLPELDTIIPESSVGVRIASNKLRESARIPDPTSQISVESQQKLKSSKLPNVPEEEMDNVANEAEGANTKAHPNNSHQRLDSPQPKKTEEHTYIYKILAFDTASNEVAVATTSSSIKHKSSVPRSAAGLLVHLDQPAKYFSYMESLDAEGFQLVSGSRTMLVYRKRVNPDGTASANADKSSVMPGRSLSMKPLREEPVFSGHLQPKERLLRSYQLAHRRAEADNAKSSTYKAKTLDGQDSALNSEATTEEPIKQRSSRGFAGRFVTVVLVVTICYTIGLVRNIRERREFEEGMRMRREEAALRKAVAEKNDWRSWF